MHEVMLTSSIHHTLTVLLPERLLSLVLHMFVGGDAFTLELHTAGSRVVFSSHIPAVSYAMQHKTQLAPHRAESCSTFSVAHLRYWLCCCANDARELSHAQADRPVDLAILALLC